MENYLLLIIKYILLGVLSLSGGVFMLIFTFQLYYLLT